MSAETFTPHRHVYFNRFGHGALPFMPDGTTPRCCASITDRKAGSRLFFRQHQCDCAGKVQDASGNWWCGMHSPEADAKRAAKQKAADDARYAARMAEVAQSRLRNAAPDLLAALKAAVELYGKPGGPWSVPSDPGSWIAMAREAIAKAEGNP